MTIVQNLDSIREAIENATRDKAVTLLAVSKTFGVEAIKEAIDAGQLAFGENYVQEGVEKIAYFREHFPELKLTWHMIGPLQSNKTRVVAENFDWVQSLDRVKIAKRLSEQRPAGLDDLNVLVEVNIDAESSKSGVGASDVEALARAIAQMPRLRLRGLMCIPDADGTAESHRAAFQKMKALMESLNAKGFALDTLSMGMSADFCEAIQEGATLVRVGSAIFGQRDYSKSRKEKTMQKKIAMLGGGNMASALVAGLVAAGVQPKTIDVMDRNEDKCERLRSLYNVNTHLKGGDWLKEADIVVLAVKPQGLAQTIAATKEFFKADALFISIAAGIRVESLVRWLGSDRVVRSMPNTPALVKAGVVGLYVPANLSDVDRDTAKTIVSAMGEIIEVPSEPQLDVLSTVSGSGPAYVFRFIEALEAAAVGRGFDGQLARRMAILTVVGAAKLATISQESPAKLRENVTSKGGTTAEALRIMQEHDFMGMMDEAVQAAYDRSQVLADELGKP